MSVAYTVDWRVCFWRSIIENYFSISVAVSTWDLHSATPWLLSQAKQRPKNGVFNSKSGEDIYTVRLSTSLSYCELNLGIKQLGTDIIKISVGTGPSTKEFAIHKTLLSPKASTFDRSSTVAFQRSWAKPPHFPDDHVESFEMFCGLAIPWRYWTFLPPRQKENWTSPLQTLWICREIWNLLRRLYNGYIQQDVERSKRISWNGYDRRRIRPHSVGVKATVISHKLLCVHLVDVKGVEDSWKTEAMLPDGPHRNKILLDGLNHVRPLVQNKPVTVTDPTLAPACDYHQHGKDEKCPYAEVTRKEKSWLWWFSLG